MLPGRWEAQPHPAGRHVGHDRLRTLLAQLPSNPGSPRPDAVLLTATRSGDADAYAELLRRHEPAGRLLLASLPDGSPGRDSRVRDAAAPTAEDRLRAAGDQVLGTVHAGTGPRVAFRPFFLRAVLRVSTSTPLDAGNGLRRSEQDPAEPADPADTALAHLPESVLTALWHIAVERDSPDRLAVVLGTEAADAAVAGYRAEAAYRRVYVRHLLDERADTPARCREILEALGRHTFDGLYDNEAEVVTDHLRTCETCADLHQRLVAAGAALRERLAGLVLGPYAPGYLAALRRSGPPAFALVDPAARPLGPQPVTPSWTERIASSGRQLWAGAWATGATSAGSLAGSAALRGRSAGLAAVGTLAAGSVAALAWGTVAMLGGTTPVSDADRVRVPGNAAGNAAEADGPPRDDWMGFVQDSPAAPGTGPVRPTTPPTAAVTPEVVEAARPAARSDVTVDRRPTPRTKPTVTDGPLATAPAPTPSRTATSAPVPGPDTGRSRTSTPPPPPPSHPAPEPTPTSTSEPSPPPTSDPSPPPTSEPVPTTPATPPPDAPA
ncbi:hypothetical protein [Actinopolymorpha cephalotaxi]|uniref:Zinc-finger n=1 Tax=Actinopolymorpha cephalotaxi TaxID=504797 RepID=A0ABX2SGH4_9ACTN|nr:hypothetical protein [Actinopolymorpha cephalotaxi]NYH87271.1 hypothetical protein [Actinopolymorpha cephalotaxi]